MMTYDQRKLKHVSKHKNDMIYVVEQHAFILPTEVCVNKRSPLTASQAAKLLLIPRLIHSSLSSLILLHLSVVRP